MKLFNSQQIYNWDKFTMNESGVDQIQLISLTAQGCVEKLLNLLDKNKTVSIFCGTGNNGADGLAIAELLLQKGYQVSVYIVSLSSNPSPGFLFYLNKLEQNQAGVNWISALADMHIGSHEQIIDALLGIGNNKPASGLLKETITQINQCNAKVISIDIPSGLQADWLSINQSEVCIKANYTLTIMVPKLSFMIPDNLIYIGNIMVVNIGLSKHYYSITPSNYYWVNQQVISQFLKPINRLAHKGTKGHLAVIAGSKGKMGAAILCAQAALKSGCGLVTAIVPEIGYQIMQVALPECMVLVDGEEQFNEKIYAAVAIGPGLGVDNKAIQKVKTTLSIQNKPVIIDADGINVLSKLMQQAYIKLPQNCVITPHPKEFKRLLQETNLSFTENLEQAQKFAINQTCVVVLKNAITATVLPNGKVYFNSTGNQLLATAGSGDVLTGIIASCCAQGYESWQAAVLGVYLHGMCADNLYQQGKGSILSSEISNELSHVLFNIDSGS